MRKAMIGLALLMATIGSVPVAAQVRTIDPNQAIDGDLSPAPQPASNTAAPPADQTRYPDTAAPPSTTAPAEQAASSPIDQMANAALPPSPADATAVKARTEAQADAARGDTFRKEEILSAAEGTFGKGAAGLAGIIERTLKEQGYPVAYISGREAGGAIAIGLRYGAGTMYHKIEGQMPVHWTGPSIGFDLGGDASKVFVLVYNLYDSEKLFSRFPAGEGRLYVVGGFAASYLRRGNVVLIPIRLGVGWRQGVNVGYMKFTHKGQVLPF